MSGSMLVCPSQSQTLSFCPSPFSGVSMGINHFQRLPERLLVRVFTWLRIEDLKQVIGVCKRFRKQLSNLALCRLLCYRKWAETPLSVGPLIPKDCDWTWLALCLMNPVQEEQALQLKNPSNLYRLNFMTREGEIYIGEYVGGKKNGKGVEILPSGVIYIGDYFEGKKEGAGIRHVPSIGETYEGEWRNDLMTGTGKKVFKGGCYSGEWNEGQRHGYGTFNWASGSLYEGSWDNDLKDGYGVYKWKSGDKYKGQWKAGKYDFGCYSSYFGSIYCGTHNQEGRYDGIGKFTHPDGYEWKGSWKNGVPENPRECVHPNLREALERKECTKSVTGASPFYGQVLYKCKCLDDSVCKVCSETCHRGHVFSEVFWTVGRTTCQCSCTNHSH